MLGVAGGAGRRAVPRNGKRERTEDAMAIDLRVATFNVENLFDRAKLLNLDDPADGDVLLGKVAELKAVLKQPSYTTSRKQLILSLYQELKDYVTLVETREKLFNRYKTQVVAAGRGDWEGWLAFKRDRFADPARGNTAKVIRAVNAQVIGLVEVEDRIALKRFSAEKITGTKKYPCNMCIDGNDDRGIDVGILSRLPIAAVCSHSDDRDGSSPIFSRDCLEVQIKLPNGKDLWVLLNHFKSKGYGVAAESNAKRRRQAERVAEILAEKYDLSSDLVVVCGDFNDTPGSAPLAPLLGVAHLHDVLELTFQNPADRWTYRYQQNQQIDYLLVSEPLKDALQGAGVERRGIYEVDQFSGGAISAFPTVTGKTSSASDHGAVWADFQLPE
jgi:predicted extracellular nuclease